MNSRWLLFLALFAVCAAAAPVSNNVFGTKQQISTTPYYWVETNWALTNSSSENYSFSFGNSSYAVAPVTLRSGATNNLDTYYQAQFFWPYNTSTGLNTSSSGKLVLTAFRANVSGTTATITWGLFETDAAQGCNSTQLATGTFTSTAAGTYRVVSGINAVLNTGKEYCLRFDKTGSVGQVIWGKTGSAGDIFGYRGQSQTNLASWTWGADELDLQLNFSEYVPVRSPLITTNTSSGVINFSGNNLTSGASVQLWANGSGAVNYSFDNRINKDNSFPLVAQSVENLAFDGNTVPATVGGTGNITFGAFHPPQNYNFSNCALYAMGQSLASDSSVNLSVSSNGTNWVSVYNLVGVATNNSIIILAPFLDNNQTIWFRWQGKNGAGSASSARIGEVNTYATLNCSLSNSSALSLPVLTSGANNLTATVSNGSANYNVTVSRNETPTLVLLANSSATNAAIASVGINISNATSSFQNTSDAQGVPGAVRFPMSWLWDGSATVVLTATGYNTTNTTTTLNSSTATAHEFRQFLMNPANLNIYVYDEATQAPINVSISISNTTNTVNYSNVQNLSLSYAAIPQGAVTVYVSNATNYNPRFYSVTVASNVATNLNAYLPQTSVYTALIRFHVSAGSQTGVSGAQVSIRRWISGAWVTVGQQTTDSSGTASFYMDINTQYQVVVLYGSLSTTLTVLPTNQDYYVTLGASSVVPPTSYTSNFSSSLTPTTMNDSTDITTISFNTTALDSSLTAMNLSLFYSNGTMFYNNNVTGSPAGGMIQVAVNKTGKDPYIIVSASASRSGGWATEAYNKTYITGTYGNASYSWTNVATQLQGSDLSVGAKVFLTIFLAILTTAFLSRHSPSGWSGLLATLSLTFWAGMFGGLGAIVIVGGFVGVLWLVWTKVIRGQ